MSAKLLDFGTYCKIRWDFSKKNDIFYWSMYNFASLSLVPIYWRVKKVLVGMLEISDSCPKWGLWKLGIDGARRPDSEDMLNWVGEMKRTVKKKDGLKIWGTRIFAVIRGGKRKYSFFISWGQVSGLAALLYRTEVGIF